MIGIRIGAKVGFIAYVRKVYRKIRSVIQVDVETEENR